MSVATYINSIESSRNTIRNKLVELGLVTSTAKLDALAAAIEDIVNQGAVSVTVQEGSTYTIPKGYHNGSGTVSGVSGGSNYTLQSKTATPTKRQQNITPDSGYYGLSDVTVGAIPEAYQDVSSVTAAAGDVLTGKVIVLADGTIKAGTMPDNGTVSKTLDATTVSYTIPAGKHSGSGKVTITLETKTVTPTKAAQDITPTAGKVLSKVTVNPIPEQFVDNSSVTATDEKVLDGEKYGADGEVRTGSMPDNGAVNKTLDATSGNQSAAIAEGYHSGAGKISIVLEEKSATPTKSAQTITPTSGKVISKVTVAKIPDEYQDVTGVTATAPHVLDGDVFVDATGAEVPGTMPNNGALNGSVDGITTTSVDVPAGYTSGGKFEFDDTKIAEMLDAI